MSTPTAMNPVTPSKIKAKRPKDKDKAKDRDRKERAQLPSERLKIVVRRLPPTLPEEIFWKSVSIWVTDESVSWKAFYPGKPKKRANKENIPSRAYIAFKTAEQLLNFSREYDGHTFIDKAGTESYAVVEYAPYQKIPGEKKKPDSRHATIEKDEDYISFIESLNASVNAEPVTIESLVASIRPPTPPKTTPLLEALKAEKQAQKDKEAIIRNHPHYKDIMNGPPVGVLRKEEKRKAARAEVTQVAGKKGKKGSAPPPPPSKLVQTQSNTSASAHNGNSAPAAPVKAQPSPARPGRKHATKHSKGTAPAPAQIPAQAQASVPKDTPVSPVAATKAPPPTQSQTQDGVPSVASPTRRGRPVLGLGSRHFEAALNGVGVAGGRKRTEKSKEGTPATPVQHQENVSHEKSNPSMSPKRPRHRKEGTATSVTASPDVNGASVLAVPSVVQTNGGGPPPSQANGVRGGKRGGRGGGGRGRGGPPRVG